jgi:hypothetical protein
MSAAPTSNRKFGLVLASGFLGLTVLVYLRKHAVSPVLLTLAGGFAAAALVYSPLLGPVQRVWIKVGSGLGFINTRLLLGLIYFLLVTPIALLLRLFRRQPIESAPNPASSTYWRRRDAPGDGSAMERQF